MMASRLVDRRGAVVRLRPRRSPGSPSRRRARLLLVLSDSAAMALAMAVAGSWSVAGWAYACGVLASLSVSGGYLATDLAGGAA